MATIHRPHFTGQIGRVRFVNGTAETTDPDALKHFRADPDTYTVSEDAQVPPHGDDTDAPDTDPHQGHTDPQE